MLQQPVFAAFKAQILAKALTFRFQKRTRLRVDVVGAAWMQQPVLARFLVVPVDARFVTAHAEGVDVEAHCV